MLQRFFASCAIIDVCLDSGGRMHPQNGYKNTHQQDCCEVKLMGRDGVD